jgi:hypothetical protein
MHRIGPQPQALHYGYEKAGLIVYDQPIPWNAEAVLVEAQLRLPASSARRRSDFLLKVQGLPAFQAELLRRQQSDDWFRLLFRFPPAGRTVAGELLWKHQRLGQITLPALTREEFLQNVRLEMPTLFVRLENQTVACKTFVSTQCRGLVASAVLSSPTSLVPMMELALHVELRSERGGAAQSIPAQFTTSQMAQRQALVSVVPRRLPRRMGTWLVTWQLADRILLTQRVRAVSQKHFLRSLRVADSRFVVEPPKGRVKVCRQLPAHHEIVRAGPCFLAISQEPGMAGLASFQVRAQINGATQQPVLFDQEVLVTDGPTLVAPGTLEQAELAQVSGFELCLRGETLGIASTSPIPAANFTSEGGFRPANEFPWTAAADEELTERLNRLLEEKASGK